MNSQKQNVFVTNSVLHKVLPGLCWQINQSPWKTERRKNIDGFRVDGFLIIWMTSWYKCVFEVERTYLVPVQRKCDMFGVEDKRKQLMNFGLENIIIIWNTRVNGYQLWGKKKWKKTKVSILKSDMRSTPVKTPIPRKSCNFSHYNIAFCLF